MKKLASCPDCHAFLPAAASACPHCDRTIAASSLGTKLAFIGGAALLSMTLSACYGAGVVTNPFCTDSSRDTDGDGYCLNLDCNESDRDVHAYAADPAGDGIDQNCDGADGTASGDGGTGDSGL